MAETGLNQNYFRDYDPAVGRYVESDPIGFAGGSYSTYAYVRNAPTNDWDESGLAPGDAVPSASGNKAEVHIRRQLRGP
jgi:uncharacterized protein RhaS with RHS repeats